MSTDTGGPARPHLGLYRGADGDLHPTPTQDAGMTLLDYFAGQALTGLWASIPEGSAGAALREGTDPHKVMAVAAYRQAEAMIAEKRRREE